MNIVKNIEKDIVSEINKIENEPTNFVDKLLSDISPLQNNSRGLYKSDKQRSERVMAKNKNKNNKKSKVVTTTVVKSKNTINKNRKKNKALKSGVANYSVAPAALGVGMAMRPMRIVSSRKNSRNGLRVSGTEFMQAVTTLSTNDVGDVLVTIPIMPALLANTNLQVLSQLFEFYKFVNLRMCYVPSCSTATAGQVVGFFDDDPNSIVRLVPNGSGDVTNVRIAYDHEGSGMNSLWAPGCYRYSKKNRNPQFATDPNYVDPRTSIQCTFCLVQSAVASTASASYGDLYLEYDLELWGKEYTQDVAGTGNYFYNVSASPFSLNGSTATISWTPASLVSDLAQMSNLPYSFATYQNTNDVITLPPGWYYVSILSKGWASTLAQFAISAVNGATGANGEVTFATLGTTSIGIQTAILQIPSGLTTSPGFVLKVTYTSTPVPGGFSMYILSLPNAIVLSQWDIPAMKQALRLAPYDYDDFVKKKVKIDREESSTRKLANKLAFMLTDGVC